MKAFNRKHASFMFISTRSVEISYSKFVNTTFNLTTSNSAAQSRVEPIVNVTSHCRLATEQSSAPISYRGSDYMKRGNYIMEVNEKKIYYSRITLLRFELFWSVCSFVSVCTRAKVSQMLMEIYQVNPMRKHFVTIETLRNAVESSINRNMLLNKCRKLIQNLFDNRLKFVILINLVIIIF